MEMAMFAIGVLFAIQRAQGLRIPKVSDHVDAQANAKPVSNASDLGHHLLRMMRDSNEDISSLRISGGATTFVAGIGQIPTIVVETRMLDPYPFQGAANTGAMNP